MEITQVSITIPGKSDGRVVAYCTVVFERSFIVKDLRIIDRNSELFVAMPSRKKTRECDRCQGKNNLNVNFCNHCGTSLAYVVENTAPKSNGRDVAYIDIAHPITTQFREKMEREIIAEYKRTRARAG